MTPKAQHPNRIPFAGVLTFLDQPSDAAPSGSRGHRVLIPRATAEAALDSLDGMAISFETGWGGHDPRQKCGVITRAYIEGDALRVAGHLFSRDFPEVAKACGEQKGLGMSYELINAHVADMRADVWVLTSLTFTGAAILLRDRAAHRKTLFTLNAAEERFNGQLSFTGTGSVTVVSD